MHWEIAKSPQCSKILYLDFCGYLTFETLKSPHLVYLHAEARCPRGLPGVYVLASEFSQVLNYLTLALTLTLTSCEGLILLPYYLILPACAIFKLGRVITITLDLHAQPISL